MFQIQKYVSSLWAKGIALFKEGAGGRKKNTKIC